jgi:hypothetical protein
MVHPLTLPGISGNLVRNSSKCESEPILNGNIRPRRVSSQWKSTVRSADGIEAEADEFAKNALVPLDLWRSRVSSDMDHEQLLKLAAEAGVHPAIVAGRWQYENSDYRKFSRLLGRGEPKTLLSTQQ